jgi:hypothetical protein
MFQHALTPIARAFDEPGQAEHFRNVGQAILAAAIRRFWSAEQGLFVNNLPWLDEEQIPRLCDRSLATAVLYDQCPSGQIAAAERILVECPPEMGRSYPANACWRYWALARLGRVDVVVKDFRERWAGMAAVVQNTTIQEFWDVRPDTADQWSHCAIAPISVLFTDIAGIRPVAPGFARCQVRPQLGHLAHLDLTAYTVRGPIRLVAELVGDQHHISLTLPPDCAGELLLPAGIGIDLQPLAGDHPLGLSTFRLDPGRMYHFSLPST